MPDPAPENSLANNRALAEKAFRYGHFAVAADALRAVIAFAPEDIDAISSLGLIQLHRGELEEAEATWLRILALAGDEKKWQADANCGLGLVYLNRGDLAKAEEYYRNALAISEAMNDKFGMASQYSALGSVCFKRGEFGKAEEHNRSALAICEATNDKRGAAASLENLGVLAEKRGDFAAAHEWGAKALNLYMKIGKVHDVWRIQGWIDDFPKE